MAKASRVAYVPLEERLPGDLKAWEVAALRFAVGVHDALVREDATAREAFSFLCGDRYCGACECKDGVPAGTEYVVCMSKEEADRCVPMAGPGVTPLLGFQLNSQEREMNWEFQPQGDPFGPLCDVERLAFSFTADEIDDLFACRFEMLTSVDFSGVRDVISINDRFMDGCCSLRSFDFAPFKGVRNIGCACLASCDEISHVNLRGLENVRIIGSGFLVGCRFETLDLRPLRSLESIGDEFLGSTGLTALDLEPLHAIKQIPDHFLSYCLVQSLDFSPQTHVESLGEEFLVHCEALRTVNFRGLENVRSLGDSFLRGCESLDALDLSPLRNVEAIGARAFEGCKKLRHVNFSHLCDARETDLKGFVDGCGALSDESRASAEAFKEECRRRGANKNDANEDDDDGVGKDDECSDDEDDLGSYFIQQFTSSC